MRKKSFIKPFVAPEGGKQNLINAVQFENENKLEVTRTL